MSIKFKKTDYIEAESFLEKIGGAPLTFSRMMESLRLCEEMSQVEFARKLHISRSHLCDIEKGRKTVSPARAVKFAKILGYSEKLFIALALQDMVQKEGLKFKVTLEAA